MNTHNLDAYGNLVMDWPEHTALADVLFANYPGKDRITPDDLLSVIKEEDFHVFPGSCLTVCALTLMNGYVVTGQSACADPANFNDQIGRSIARDHAINAIWPLVGLLLREHLVKK